MCVEREGRTTSLVAKLTTQITTFISYKALAVANLSFLYFLTVPIHVFPNLKIDKTITIKSHMYHDTKTNLNIYII